MGDPIPTFSRSSHAYAELINSMGPEDDDDRGGGGTECEAYHSRSDDTWTPRIVMPSGLSSVHRHPAFYGRWFYRSIKNTKGEKERAVSEI